MCDLLKAIATRNVSQAEVKVFINSLRQLSGGWPKYGELDKRTTMFRVLDLIEKDALCTTHFDGLIELLEGNEDEPSKVEPVCWGDAKFFCPHEVRFKDLRTILGDWKHGHAEAREVIDFADNLALRGGGWPTYPDEDPRSILYMTLEAFELIYSEPILREDIPAFEAAIDTAMCSPVEAWEGIHAYFDAIDWDLRLSES